MSIKTILVPLDGTEAAGPALNTAFGLGKKLAAHVDVLHVRTDAKDAVPLLGEGMSGAMIEEMIEMAEKDASDRSANAKVMFDKACSDSAIATATDPSASGGPSAGWHQLTGREDEITAWRGRLSDLIVVGRPGAESDPSATLTLNAALFESGRPVLLAPQGPAVDVGRHIAIAWNGSAEAARSAAAAMTLLRKADKVTIFGVEADSIPVEIDIDLAGYLAWHGVKAEAGPTLPDDRNAGEAILNSCARIGADMLVMGAYTHSRLRQLIMGGVTRHVLAAAELPVFMAH